MGILGSTSKPFGIPVCPEEVEKRRGSDGQQMAWGLVRGYSTMAEGANKALPHEGYCQPASLTCQVFESPASMRDGFLVAAGGDDAACHWDGVLRVPMIIARMCGNKDHANCGLSFIGLNAWLLGKAGARQRTKENEHLVTWCPTKDKGAGA
eukprot:scaffold201446_cov17-Tisochrysis_lutea.AAC.1